MRVLLLMVATVLSVVLESGAALSQGTAKSAGQYQFGSWDISAHFDGSNKEFLSCMAAVPMDGDADFGLALTRYDVWAILVVDTASDWGQRSDVPVSWQVDGFAQRSKKAIADNEAVMVLDIPRSAVTELREARRVRTNVGGRNRVADLDDTAGAMRELQRCVASRGKTTKPAPPATARPAPGAPPGRQLYAGWWFDEKTNSAGIRTCSAISATSAGTTVALSLRGGSEWDLIAHNKTWKLGSRKAIRLAYRVDRGPARDARATSGSDVTVAIPLRTAQAVEEIARGSELALELQGGRYLADITGASRVVPALRDCMESGLSAALRPPPAPAAPPPAAAPPSNNPPDYQVGAGASSASTTTRACSPAALRWRRPMARCVSACSSFATAAG